jgi:tRNA-specific 2-thiouridylase
LSAFLRTQTPSLPGDIVDEQGKVLGQHEGLVGYTVGQRHRLFISQGGEAWYVAKKDLTTNRLVVVPGEDHPLLFTRQARVTDLHWTTKPPMFPLSCTVQVRYRQTPISAELQQGENGSVDIFFSQPVKAVAPGQSAVFYVGDECLGGGVLF